MALVAEIIKVAAPSQVSPGETVIVDVSVKNIAGGDRYIGVRGAYDSTKLSWWQFEYLLVAPGQTVIFRGWFTMPSKNVSLTIWGWYWDGAQWQPDATRTLSISALIYPRSDIANLLVTVTGGLEYPKADIANLIVAVSGGLEYPKADIANLVVTVSGGLEYPKADIANFVVVVSGGLEYPKADIANFIVRVSGGIAVDFENLMVTYKKV